jgi:deoxyribodipyrimidine photo-lyase
MTAGVVWFRRDLRLEDNPAWAAATATHDEVVAVFVVEAALMNAAGPIRRDQLLAHLHALDDDLRARGGGLVIRSGPAESAIPRAISESEASALYLNADVTPFSTARDHATEQSVTVPVHTFNGLTVHEPGAVLTKKGTLSQVFTPFYKTWTATHRTPWPSGGPGRSVTLPGDPFPDPQGPVRQTPGETAAWDRLTSWLEIVEDYPEARDMPAVDGTSNLSADLRFGTLSARTVVDVVGSETRARQAFVRQIAWRDWWAHTLALRPDLPHVALKAPYDGIAWRDDPDGFERWCTGRTGYPIVDAGMRQLIQTGWMHNRVRMICASFLVKDLLIDWRKGERFFRHHLVDADIAQNAGNWQWVAGTGPDAAPYFRVFNPTSQGQKFDPDGRYVRRWVPELADVPAAIIHQPRAASPNQLAASGVTLDEIYPAPIVDHNLARKRALETYKRALT